MTATVSVRGQVVIPAAIRKKLKIKPHTKVEFIEKEDSVVLYPLPKDPIRASYGMWKRMGINIPSDDIIKMRREWRKKEKEKYKRLYDIR